MFGGPNTDPPKVFGRLGLEMVRVLEDAVAINLAPVSTLLHALWEATGGMRHWKHHTIFLGNLDCPVIGHANWDFESLSKNLNRPLMCVYHDVVFPHFQPHPSTPAKTKVHSGTVRWSWKITAFPGKSHQHRRFSMTMFWNAHPPTSSGNLLTSWDDPNLTPHSPQAIGEAIMWASQATVDGSDMRRSPPGMYETLANHGKNYQPQRICQISEPSTEIPSIQGHLLKCGMTLGGYSPGCLAYEWCLATRKSTTPSNDQSFRKGQEA